MATRLTLPRIELPADPRARVAAWREEAARVRRPLTRQERWRLAWRALWLPYWFGSDVAAPQLPARDQAPPPAGLAGDQVARMLTQIARRVWIQRAVTVLVRSCWLGVLVGCIWLIVELSGGPALDIDALIVVAVALAVPGVLLAAMLRPTRRQVAHALDRSYHLKERMTTAVDNLGKAVPSAGQPPTVPYLQMADAANVITELRRNPCFKVRPPVREIVLGIAFSLLMASLFFLRGVGGHIPDVESAAVPRFVPATERFAEEAANAAAAQAAEIEQAPTTAEVEQRAQRSHEARRDLQALAQSLDDHAVTRTAADAIQRGDYEDAANDLRELSADADQLSESAREGLANDLEEAASRMSPGSENLANAANDAAAGLRQGEQSAEQGVRELGDAVEQTGNEVVSQQELAQQMEQAQTAEASGQQSGQQAQDAASQSQSQSQSQQQAGEPGAPTDPDSQSGQSGSSGDAQPGEGQQGEPSDDPSQQNPGGQQSGEPGQPGDPGGMPGEGEPGGAQQPGDPGGQESMGGPETGQQGETAGGAEAAQANQGDGAGASSGDQQQEGEAGGTQEGDQGGSSGPPADEQLKEGQAGVGEAGEAGGANRDAIQLSRGPDGQSIRTSEDGGSSSLGSGTGVTVSGGTSVQGEIGEAGPDSNRVPPAYRQVVEDYFSDPSENR